MTPPPTDLTLGRQLLVAAIAIGCGVVLRLALEPILQGTQAWLTFWPAAFLAQRWLRHKSLKPGYQFIFWLIVFLHQFAALDSLLNWKFSSIILAWFGRR